MLTERDVHMLQEEEEEKQEGDHRVPPHQQVTRSLHLFTRASSSSVLSSQPIRSLNIHTSVSCVICPHSHPSTNRFSHPPCPLSCAGTFIFHLSVKPSSQLSLLNTNKAINTTLQYTDCHHHFNAAKHSLLLILCTTVLVLPFHHIRSS